jgi:hypothetical protein
LTPGMAESKVAYGETGGQWPLIAELRFRRCCS